MLPVIIVAAVVCILLILTVLTNPVLPIGRYRIKIFYWAAPLAGAIILVVSGLLPVSEVWAGLTSSGSINPLKILVLFISMTTLSVFLDEAGFFSYLAGMALKASAANRRSLFLILFLMVSVLTVFTSNDVIILTFTPFICYFCKKAEIDPVPYLFGEFVAANTLSMMLIIGNPTNIYLGTYAGISFWSFTRTMFFPTIFAGIAAAGIILLIFKKELSAPITLHSDSPTLEDKGLVIIGVIHLALCTILLIISSYIGLEMWYITLGFAVSLFICVSLYKIIRKKIGINKKKGSASLQSSQNKIKKFSSGTHTGDKILLHTLARAPWELIPFVLSMFLIVLSLDKNGVTESICSLLGSRFIIWKAGIISFLSANIMNNIPMSVFFGSITSHLPSEDILPATYATVIASNIGAYFTPLGALAGIMWSGILKKMGISFSFRKYISYGIRISIPVLAVALAVLSLVIKCFHFS